MAAQREWFEKDYYKVLGVSETATAKEITKSYRQLARDSHPDTHPGDAAAEERFKAVSTAYDVLGDDTKRKEYDEVRRYGPSAAGGPGGFQQGDGNFSFNVGGEGLSDILGQMFGGGGRRRGAGPQRGGDIEAVLSIDFVDAVDGLTTTLHLTSDTTCSSCNGSGARAGTSPQQCPQCYGRGVVEDNQGPFAFSSPCTRCSGRGVIIEYPCVGCRGSGIEKRPREVKVRIPAGVDNGQRIRLKGRGTPGRNGGPPGDLFVVCNVSAHSVFGRDGLNLSLRLPITFAEAALGAQIDVPTLDGSTVTLRLKPGTQSGSRHRVKGKGITTKSAQGDLIVTVDVAVPTTLSDEERHAVELLATHSTSPRDKLFSAGQAKRGN